MNVLSVVMLVVFAMFGVISMLKNLSYYLFRYKKDNTVMFVTPLSGRCEDAEFMLRSAVAKVKWVSRGKNDFVICLDCDMDEETKRICEKICSDYGFIKLISKKEFIEML